MPCIKYWDSLKNLTKQRPRIKSDLRTMIMSPTGITLLWVLVEGEADTYFYERLFSKGHAKVLIAGRYDKAGQIKGGMHAVKEVVDELLSLGISSLIIGIIDRDWQMFYRNRVKLSHHLFVTDHRDLEMTLLSVEQVRSFLVTEIVNNMIPGHVNMLGGGDWFQTIWKNSCDISRYMGALRIVVAHFQLHGLHFKTTLYWDDSTKRVIPGWECNLFNEAVALSAPLSKMRFFFYCWWVEIRYNLKRLSIYDVCRGHDFLHILSTMLINSQFSERWMTYFMAMEISSSEIRSLKLYKSIDEWMNTKGISYLI